MSGTPYVINRIEFHGNEIEAFEHEGRVWIVLKRVCENLGVAPRDQSIKVKENPAFEERWAYKILPTNGGAQSALCLDLDALSLWLGSISAAKVNPEVRDVLIAYQRECMSVLRRHFFPDFPPAQQPGLRLVEDVERERDHAVLRTVFEVVPSLVRDLEALKKTVDYLYYTANAAVTRSGRAEGRSEKADEKSDQALAMAQRAEDHMIQCTNHKEVLALPDGSPNQRKANYVVEMVNRIVDLRGGEVTHASVWYALGRAFVGRYRIDLIRRAANRRTSMIDYAKTNGLMGRLYALAYHELTGTNDSLSLRPSDYPAPD